MITRVIQGGNTSMTQPYHLAGQKGYSYNHLGVDLTGYNGQYNIVDWLVAHSDGVVVELRTDCDWFESGSYGNYVMLRHSNGYFTLYAHIAFGTIKVKYGETVKKGQVLGLLGNTGESYGAHCHFEIRNTAGVQIDPEPYLNDELPGMIKPLNVNGSWNKGTTRRLQYIFGTSIDGIISDQAKSNKVLCPACNAVTSWKFVKKPTNGSMLIKAMQKKFKQKQTGIVDQQFIVALQKRLGVKVSKVLDKKTVKALQMWINKKLS